MAGFPEMRSSLNERLFPRVARGEKVEDRFLSRHKHIPEPQPRPEFVDHGKKFNLSYRDHNKIFDTQLHHMQPRESTILNSSLQTTRFHHGFRRSMHAQKDFYTRTDAERVAQTARRDKGIEHDRKVFVSRHKELQPDADPQAHVNFKADLAPVVPKEPKSEARKRHRQLDDQKSIFDPPPALETLRAVGERRRDLVQREGLTETLKYKKHSIGSIVQSCDGFAVQSSLPEIATPRRQKNVSQMKSQFTLG